MDGAAKRLLLGEVAVVLGALAGHGVGFDLRGPLRHQAEGLFDRSGQLFFDLAQVLFGMGKDYFQARIHVLEPGLDFGFGQVSFSQAGGLGCRSGSGRSSIEDLLGQALRLCVRALTGGLARGLTRLRPANLA